VLNILYFVSPPTRQGIVLLRFQLQQNLTGHFWLHMARQGPGRGGGQTEVAGSESAPDVNYLALAQGAPLGYALESSMNSESLLLLGSLLLCRQFSPVT
jgi:hypothetical protein